MAATTDRVWAVVRAQFPDAAMYPEFAQDPDIGPHASFVISNAFYDLILSPELVARRPSEEVLRGSGQVLEALLELDDPQIRGYVCTEVLEFLSGDRLARLRPYFGPRTEEIVAAEEARAARHQKVSALLDSDWDPLGVYDSDDSEVTPPGEYTPYAWEVLFHLEAGDTADEVAAVLAGIKGRMMNMPPGREDTRAGHVLVEWYQAGARP